MAGIPAATTRFSRGTLPLIVVVAVITALLCGMQVANAAICVADSGSSSPAQLPGPADGQDADCDDQSFVVGSPAETKTIELAAINTQYAFPVLAQGDEELQNKVTRGVPVTGDKTPLFLQTARLRN